MTRRSTFHKVSSTGTSWVLTFRGPWADEWSEWTPTSGYTRLRGGRTKVSRKYAQLRAEREKD